MRAAHTTTIWGFAQTFDVRRPLLAALGTVLLAGAAIWAVLGFLLALALPRPVAIAVAGVVALVAAVGVAVSRYRGLGRHLPETDPAPSDARRVDALIDGLRTQVGIGRVRVLVTESPSVNAAALPEGRIVLTTGAVEALTSVELEALLARELIALRENLPRGYGLLAASGRLRGTAQLRREAAMLDLAAVAITRFPPAMGQLMTKALGQRDAELARSVPDWFWAFPPADTAAGGDLELRRQIVLDEAWTLGASRPRRT